MSRLKELQQEFIIDLDFNHPYIKKLHKEVDELKNRLFEFRLYNSALDEDNERLKLRLNIIKEELLKLSKRAGEK